MSVNARCAGSGQPPAGQTMSGGKNPYANCSDCMVLHSVDADGNTIEHRRAFATQPFTNSTEAV